MPERQIVGRLRDSEVVVDERVIHAMAPASAEGFSDLIVILAKVHERWRVELPIADPFDQS